MYQLGERTIERLKSLNGEQQELLTQVNIIEGQKRSVLESVLKMNNADLSKTWQLTEDFTLIEKVDNE